MRFRLHVADAETGHESTVEMECATVQEARRNAEKAGFLVSVVEPVSAPPSSPAPVAPLAAVPPAEATTASAAGKRVTEVKATCSACGNVWYYPVGERFQEFASGVGRFGESMRTLGRGKHYMPTAERRTTQCPQCGSKAISRETVTHGTPRPSFSDRMRQRKAEREKGLNPEQIKALRRRDRLVAASVIAAVLLALLIDFLRRR